MKTKTLNNISQDGKYISHTKDKKIAKKSVKTYMVINDNDPNDSFEVEAKNVNDAQYEALNSLGWWVAE